MSEVGVRGLRDHLSQCLARVKAGAEIIVTPSSSLRREPATAPTI